MEELQSNASGLDKVSAALQEGEKKVEATYNPAMSEEQLKGKYTDRYEELKTYADTCKIDFTSNNDEGEVQCLATVDDVGILERGNVDTIQAGRKEGKSHLTYTLASVVLGNIFGRLKPTAKGLNVVVFDTEQSKGSVWKGCNKVREMCHGLKDIDKHFFAFSLKCVDLPCRMDLIRFVVDAAEVKPDLIVIDGAADLIPNFNDNEKSRWAVEQLTTLAEKCNCAILACIHENRSPESLAKGHLGALLLEKSFSIMKVKRNGNPAAPTFKVSHILSREEQFMPFAFKLDADAVPIPADAEQKPGEPEDEFSKVKEEMRKVFEGKDTMRHTDIVHEYLLKIGLHDRQAKDRIKYATENNILVKKGKLYKFADGI